MVSRIHSSDARGICRIILPESWKCNPLGMGQKGASFNLWKRKAAVKMCTDKNLLLLLVRNSPQNRLQHLWQKGMETSIPWVFCMLADWASKINFK